MNIKTCRAIESVINHMDMYDQKDHIKILTIDKYASGKWFYRMKIVTSHRYKHLLSHFEGIGVSIGHLYGEGLCHEIKKRTLLFS